MLDYMANSKPIFCVANPESDIHSMLSQSNSGVSVNTTKGSVEVFQKFSSLVSGKIKLKDLGQNGYNYAKKNFDIEPIVKGLLTKVEKERIQ